MTDYIYPLEDTEFVLNELVKFDELCDGLGRDDVNSELASAILSEAGKLASSVLAPLNKVGDQNPPSIVDIDGAPGVKEPEGFADAYKEYVAGGWPLISAPEELGGQNLPNVLAMAINEIWMSANLSFSAISTLGQGASESVRHHASDELRNLYLPKMISGEWACTMNLTEPDAGTDLAAVKTKAIPEEDHYLITGQKIFITWGDHQMTDNVVHLVLARLPDAPPGVRGISLFLVPKFVVDENGNSAARNDAYAIALEHKLGLHGCATCVMSYGEHGGAKGFLVGEPNNGLACMFTMMNHARQAVGLQGLGLSEASYQQALEYAKERLQGTNRDGSRFSIIKFPDVRRMLMQMKSSIEAIRAFCLLAGTGIDQGDNSRVDLLTPIVKGWVTELTQEVTYLGIQIHGGCGFIEETGIAQFYRDARILSIYEGTNGIQGLDLVGRKTLANGGKYLAELLEEISADIKQFETLGGEFALAIQQCKTALDNGIQARQWLLDNADNKDAANSVGVSFMMLFGYLCGGWVMAKSAIAAKSKLDAGEGDSQFMQSKLNSARFFCEHLVPRTQAYLASIQAGHESIMHLEEEAF